MGLRHRLEGYVTGRVTLADAARALGVAPEAIAPLVSEVATTDGRVLVREEGDEVVLYPPQWLGPLTVTGL